MALAETSSYFLQPFDYFTLADPAMPISQKFVAAGYPLCKSFVNPPSASTDRSLRARWHRQIKAREYETNIKTFDGKATQGIHLRAIVGKCSEAVPVKSGHSNTRLQNVKKMQY